MRAGIFLVVGLTLGIVDQVGGGVALIEYERKGKIKYAHVSIDSTVCTPKEGQKVLFRGDKIVRCK